MSTPRLRRSRRLCHEKENDPPEATDHRQNVADKSPSISKTPRLWSPPKATCSTFDLQGDKMSLNVTKKNRFVPPLQVKNFLSNSNAKTANQQQPTKSSNHHLQSKEIFQFASADKAGQSSGGEAAPTEDLLTAGNPLTQTPVNRSTNNFVVSPITVSIPRKHLNFSNFSIETPSTSSSQFEIPSTSSSQFEIPSTSSRAERNKCLDDDDSDSDDLLFGNQLSETEMSDSSDENKQETEEGEDQNLEEEVHERQLELETEEVPDVQQPEAGAEEVPGQGRKRFKRRIRQPISRARQERKTARNNGEEYVNSRGNLVSEKVPLPLPECRKKCSSKLSPEVCQDLCQDLWKGLGDQSRRSSYIANLVEVKPKASVHFDHKVAPEDKKSRNYSHFYHVIVNGQNIDVCKGCFLLIFRVSPKFIDLAVRKKLSNTGGIVANDARGRASNPIDVERRDEVRNFLNRIPKYKSHYARNQTDHQFLPANLTLKIIYQQYCSEVVLPCKPVSRWVFEREFHEMGLQIKQRKIDTCHTCDKLDAAVTHAKNREEREKNEEILDQHHQKWEAARDRKRQDKVRARQDKERLRTVAFDLQQCLPTPLLDTSVVFYKRQLWTYNLTIHDCGSKDSTHTMWHEGEGERGSNQIGSALYHYIMTLPDTVEELTLWSDTCGGQNKNSIVAAALTTALLHKPTLHRIEQKFLVPGHTHMECDTDHSTIEGCKRNATEVHLPRDWMTLVRNASRKFSVFHLKTESQLDFKDLLKGRSSPLVKRKKDSAGNIFLWKAVAWMRHEQGRPGVIAYKTSHDEEAPFAFLDIRRRRNVAVTLSPQKAYSEPPAISHKKKADLVSLLDLIDPECRPFYFNLKSDGDDDFDPDLFPSSDEEESEGED